MSTEAELADSAADLGYPVVLKAMGLQHKSDAGGVVLDIHTEHQARLAFADLQERLLPPAVSVEHMIDTSGGVELIVGVRRDPHFGPVAMVGLGGVLTEVLNDVAFAIAPLSLSTARNMLLSMNGAPLLTGVRGRAPVDLDRLCRAVVRITDIAVQHPEFAELEVNPLLATPTMSIALDARAVPATVAHPSTNSDEI